MLILHYSKPPDHIELSRALPWFGTPLFRCKLLQEEGQISEDRLKATHKINTKASFRRARKRDAT